MNAPPPREAPLYTQSMALCRWCLEHFGADAAGALARAIAGDALRLLDHVVLALKDFDRAQQLDEADAALVLLRTHLRVAHEMGMLDERRFVYASGEAAEIGRQVGGWQRRLRGPS